MPRRPRPRYQRLPRYQCCRFGGRLERLERRGCENLATPTKLPPPLTLKAEIEAVMSKIRRFTVLERELEHLKNRMPEPSVLPPFSGETIPLGISTVPPSPEVAAEMKVVISELAQLRYLDELREVLEHLRDRLSDELAPRPRPEVIRGRK